MAQRPVPSGYYAMTVDELRSFIDGEHPTSVPNLLIEIDGERFPVVKMTRAGHNGAVILRVPPRTPGDR